MKVEWTNTALGHLQSIHDYVARDAPLYALTLVDRITARSVQIGQFPRSGRAVPEYEDEAVREVFEGTYRIIYEIRTERIDVLAVIHGARILPGRLR